MFYLVVISLYVGFCVLVVKGAGKLGAGKWLKVLIIIGLILMPFWDTLTAKGIMFLRYVQDRPLQEIKQTVDAPESVLWIDEVWPGFDEYGQHWMVKSYLDGKHLQTLGLTGGTETHVYTVGADGQPIKNNLNDPLPKFKYTIHFDRVRLPAWQEKFVWCDEIRIHDNEKNEDIAFSRRYLGYKSKIWPVSVGDSLFEGGARLGDERVYEFDDKVLFRYAGVRGNFEYIKDTFQRSRYNMLVINNKDRFKK